MNTPIYKICERAEWEKARSRGRYAGSGDDIRDGFIHFSTAGQLGETAAKHFAGRENLVLVAVETSSLGNALKWEPSRGGALFPHLYGALDMSAVRSVHPLPLGADGVHRLPEEIA
ncbi:MAG: DUF952 domain-containing protein [Hyphomicrobiales bacterium]|nr:DUF952 domain-containing protein [Hyphomicrobiales bacterium]